MKHWELRRALLVVTMFCVFLFIYLYWQQSTTNTKTLPTLVLHSQSKSKFNKNDEEAAAAVLWTWECVNKRCERRAVSGAAAAVSAKTCGMLCGSTQLWPQPTGPVTMSSRAVRMRSDRLRFDVGDSAPIKELLDVAVTRFTNNILNLVKDQVEEPMTRVDVERFLVMVRVKRADVVKLTLTTDESYDIDLRYVQEDIRVNVTAETFFGARHGLETLSQMIWWDEYESTLKVFKVATVKDSPAFAYRGLMIDTSRNFMSLPSLERVLEGMASNKLNVFHWHVSDSQSFPLMLPSLPQLARTGAYSSDMIYQIRDVKKLVKYARALGIRVVIEVDTPAHAGNGWSWGAQEGLGELAVCVNERPWSLYCGEPPCGQLNPENGHVFEVLETLYRDLLELSEERELFHLGGDEVNLECWAQHLQRSSSPSSSSSSSFSNYSDLHDLWGEFTVKAMARLRAANGGVRIPHVILWSSNLSKRPYLNKYLDRGDVVVQSWGASQWPDTADLLADGYKVIVSHVDAWYLDCGFGRWRETGEAACDPYRPWQTVYTHRPWQQYQKGQILGGEACLWSEQVDESSLDARLWPRAAAFAERVWSDPAAAQSSDAAAFAQFGITEDVYTRLDAHRERLAERGLRPEAMWPKWCAHNPGMCL